MEENKDKIDQSEMFVYWLESHPLISIRGLEKALGMPLGTIGHPLTRKTNRIIPEKYWYNLYLILVNYGFQYPPESEEEKEKEEQEQDKEPEQGKKDLHSYS